MAYFDKYGVEFTDDRKTLVKCPQDFTGEYIIPNDVTSIGYAAFSDCSSLTSIELPNSVTSIGNDAFCNCSGLTFVTIPNSVTSIGYYAFFNCSGLTSIEIPNSVTSIGRGAFASCDGLTSVTIPNSVTSIGECAFFDCSGLTSIEIPNSVTSIGSSAFEGCSGLTSVTIPNSVTSIGERAFYNCSGLTSIEIPNSVTSIGEEAFSKCTGLTSITLPDSVISIGRGAFDRCKNLSSIFVPMEDEERFCQMIGLKEYAKIIHTTLKRQMDFIQKPFTQMVIFNIEQLNYRFYRLQKIDTKVKENQAEYLMVFDSFLVLFRALFLDKGNKQYSVQNFYMEKGQPEKSQAINEYLDSPVFNYSNLTIRNMLKLIADKLICHTDSISREELAQANFYMSHLNNQFAQNNLQSIMEKLNEIMQ